MAAVQESVTAVEVTKDPWAGLLLLVQDGLLGVGVGFGEGLSFLLQENKKKLKVNTNSRLLDERISRFWKVENKEKFKTPQTFTY